MGDSAIPPGLLAAIETAKKFAFGLTVLAGFMLFLPDDFYETARLTRLHDDYRGVWWVVLVLSGAFAAEEYMRLLVSYVVAERSRRRERREAAEERDRAKAEEEAARRREEEALEEAKRERQAAIETRCSALSPGERQLVAYCLLVNQQSITLPMTNTAAAQLISKGLLAYGGGGRPSGTTFTVPDDVWAHLQTVKDGFVPPDRIDAWERSLRTAMAGARDWMSA
jgi:hypothetical protein